jgi:uncharacterized membrane protein
MANVIPDITPPVEERPIVVSGSAIPEQLAQAIRTALIAIAGYMAGKGWLDEELASAILPVVLLLVPFVWGQITAKRNNAVKQTLADKLPDQIAQVK